MEIIKTKTNINFLGARHFFVFLSLALIVGTFVLWFRTGDEKFGVDFRGGAELVVRFNEDVDPADIRSAFEKGELPDTSVQAFENGKRDFTLRLPADISDEAIKKKVDTVLQGIKPSGFTMLKQDFVGPVIGEQIRRDAFWAIVLSLIAMLSYVGFRFEWRFGAGGILALFHDVIITTGACLLTGRQLSAGILAALLTIVGYSINDTIVIFDRIREQMGQRSKSGGKRKLEEHSKADLIQIMNDSLNEMLSRTIITSLTAFIVVTSLYVFGGGAISDLAFALMIGVFVGSYSTIFAACPFVLLFQKEKKKN